MVIPLRSVVSPVLAGRAEPQSGSIRTGELPSLKNDEIPLENLNQEMVGSLIEDKNLSRRDI